MTNVVGAQTKNDYNLLVHKKDLNIKSFDAANVDSISFFEIPPFNTGDDFTIEEKEITSSSVKIDFIPKDKNLTYYACITHQDGFDRAWDEYGSLYNMDKDYWVWMGQIYNKDWLEVLKTQALKGDYSLDGNEDYGFILWDEVYYAYCFGLDEQGEMNTPLYLKKYKTPVPVKSDNTLLVESIVPGDNGAVKIKVNASNNDQYYVAAQKKSYVDFYVNSLGSVEAMFKYTISRIDPGMYLHKGSEEIELYCATPNTDYVLIVCGYDGGPTTEIQLRDFRTQ
ncbi:MAG: hypothetical protein PUG74_06090 [Prevotellaceae bacterium]|nr:hypothetical protein [Prevotellaceae bacterium]